jgi:hypothetical protein
MEVGYIVIGEKEAPERCGMPMKRDFADAVSSKIDLCERGEVLKAPRLGQPIVGPAMCNVLGT